MAENTNAEADIRESSPMVEYPEPNAQEAMFFYNIVKNLASQQDINWDGVAADSHFKNAAVAKKRFYQIKNKLGLDFNVSSCSTVRAGRKAKAAGTTVKAEPDTSSDIKSPKVAKRKQAANKTETSGKKGGKKRGPRSKAANGTDTATGPQIKKEEVDNDDDSGL